MEIGLYMDKYRDARYNLFRWRHELDLFYKIALALVFACCTGLMAQVRVFTPFTPVPITGQVFAVLLAGILLGKRYGGLSQIFYVGIGAAGIPWFASGASGIGYLSGVTGGYLVGFIAAAFVIGHLTDGYASLRKLPGQLTLMMIGVLIIYAFGAVWLSMVLQTGFEETMALSVIPFVPIDIAKAAIAAGIAFGILPKTPYSG